MDESCVQVRSMKRARDIRDQLVGRGLHSSTFRLIISAFCQIRWVVYAL